VSQKSDLVGNVGIRTNTYLKAVAALLCEKQVVTYTYFKVMKKRLITVNVHKECYFFVFFYTA